MNALRLAFALIRIPRLFGSLFLMPLLLSLLVVYIQLLVTGILLAGAHQTPKDVREKLETRQDQSLVRSYLLHSKKLDELIVCRWSGLSRGGEDIAPEDPRCALEAFDITLHVTDPASFDTTEFEALFNGNFRRLHVCRSTCETDIIIAVDPSGNSTHMRSTWGAILLESLKLPEEQIQHTVKFWEGIEKVGNLLGKKYFYAAGFQKPVSMEDLRETFMLVANIAILVIVALWLALKAHRKVLDYFSHSGALLPMVAAAGKSSFYAAIWILTLMRVFLFLLASVPLCYIALTEFAQKDLHTLFFNADSMAFLLWLIALLSSLLLATLIASIAELKQRHSLLSFLYRYLPFLICLIGGIVWGLTFLIETPVIRGIRLLISSSPLVGMASIILAPIFVPRYEILVVNTVLTVAILVFAVRSNVRWFAAHLEEI